MKAKQTIDNRRARYDYELSEKIVAGIALSGSEVIGIRHQRVSLKGAFIDIDSNGAYLRNLQIFQIQEPVSNDQQNTHRLLLTKSQLKKMRSGLEGSRSTIVPLKLILGKYIKLEIATATGKRRYDKRESIKQRESDRSIQRRLKGN